MSQSRVSLLFLNLIFRALLMFLPVLLLLTSCLACVFAFASPPALLHQTGQSTCYDNTGKIIICSMTGQDGEILAGAAWPVPRFTTNDDQTITDNLTGLVWVMDSNSSGGALNWQDALRYITILNSRNYLGHGDWRLPNINELESLVNKQPELAAWLESNGFFNVQPGYYWTSSSYTNHPAYAWAVGMHGGILAGHRKIDTNSIWPVRTDQPGTVFLHQTGQTTCYDSSGAIIDCRDTGQDGELQIGIPRPNPRFKDNSDHTLTDRLTGLVWSMDGDIPGPVSCTPGQTRTWQDALNYIQCLNDNNYLGQSDWRLPNRNELLSLVNRGQDDSSAWLNSQGFRDVKPVYYWSSSTYSSVTWNAWSVNMHDGAATSMAKKHKIAILPVRKNPESESIEKND